MGVAVDIISKNVWMNELFKKRATNNALKIIQKECDVVVTAMPNGQASVVCQFVNVAAYLAIALNLTLVPATRATNQSLKNQMCKKFSWFCFHFEFFRFLIHFIVHWSSIVSDVSHHVWAAHTASALLQIFASVSTLFQYSWLTINFGRVWPLWLTKIANLGPNGATAVKHPSYSLAVPRNHFSNQSYSSHTVRWSKNPRLEKHLKFGNFILKSGNPGYNWDSENAECVPVCDGECPNGKCIEPEKCECNEGFVHHPTQSICTPNCSEPCVNGECVATNKCECDQGHQFANGSLSICEPICEMSCKNAKCIEPNVCACTNGFLVADDSKPHECHCGLYCVEVDGYCHCLDEEHRVSGNRIRNNISSICSESNCVNGFCMTPNECECKESWSFTRMVISSSN